MAGIKSFLSKREKQELLEFLAATGENYDRYVDYATRRGWKVFTKHYLHTWIQRRREAFRVAREKHQVEVRRLSMYDKQRRIEDLERSVDVINSYLMDVTREDHECSICGMNHSSLEPEKVIKLMEQKRKILEAIAKERNEWLKGEVSKDSESVREKLRASLAKQLENAKETKIVDGAVVVMERN